MAVNCLLKLTVSFADSTEIQCKTNFQYSGVKVSTAAGAIQTFSQFLTVLCGFLA